MNTFWMCCKAVAIFICLAVTVAAVGCGVNGGEDWVGLPGVYNYSPSVIDTGTERQVWWCGESPNPAESRRNADAILYESINLVTTHANGRPQMVMAESPNSWDSAFSCNPKVVGGTFSNPLGDGHSYQYAMYYVGTSALSGLANSIGVAFSNDGRSWKKYPTPVIQTTSSGTYGLGQPVVYNTDGKSAIRLFYESTDPSVSHIAAISADGIHFTVQGTLTTAGLDAADPQASWGDMAYDPKADYWYAIFNQPIRATSTTGGVIERGQFGVELYRIPASALLTGTSPWQELGTVDTSATGYESNFIAGFVHDQHGNLISGSSNPDIEMYVTESDPQPSWNASPAAAGESARPPNWEMHLEKWVPNEPLLALNRYFNGHAHEVTTGWIDPSAGFLAESVLGHLYQGPYQGAALPFYGCKHGSTDYFVSLDSACEGQRILGKVGYGYSQPVTGLNLIALYSCKTDHDHFVSRDPKCEGKTTVQLLGYAVP